MRGSRLGLLVEAAATVLRGVGGSPRRLRERRRGTPTLQPKEGQAMTWIASKVIGFLLRSAVHAAVRR